MIDPRIWESAFDKGWTSDDCLVFIAAVSAADDEGRGRVSTIMRNLGKMISENKFQKCVKNLGDSLIIYDKIYYFLPKWNGYQTVSHAIPSKIPKPNPNEINNLTPKSSGIIPESFLSDSDTPPSQVKLSKYSLNEVKVSETNVDNSNGKHSNSQTSNAENSLPLLTDISDYQPEDYKNQEQVTHSIRSLLTSFCSIEDPDKSTVSSFVNIVMSTNQVKNQTAFKYVFDTFLEFHKYSDEKRNLKYLYSRVKGRIDDALIKGREERAKLAKETERKEIQDMGNENIS